MLATQLTYCTGIGWSSPNASRSRSFEPAVAGMSPPVITSTMSPGSRRSMQNTSKRHPNQGWDEQPQPPQDVAAHVETSAVTSGVYPGVA